MPGPDHGEGRLSDDGQPVFQETEMAIRSFASKPLEKLFEDGFHKRIPSDQAKRIAALLDHLDAAKTRQDLNIAGLHELKGDRKGTFAWKVTANWWLTFRFSGGDAFDVNIEDYH